jgi:alkanesulfonate monooxygenase SsuD/methylene tetrahydromethanopterin reductase-like flavin-dependent oxidoreductase (luciferase family)
VSSITFDLALPAQHISWGDYLAAAVAADRLRFETFWTWDHLLPISGNLDGSEHPAYTTLAAFAQATKRIRLGPLVTGVAYRNPAVLLKLATAINIPFPPARVRLGELRETLHLARLLWSGDPHRKVSYDGHYVQVHDLFLNPQPVQRPHPPILVGGGGEQVTLRIAAQYANLWHGFGDPATLRHKVEVLDSYAPQYGRAPSDIVKCTSLSLWVGPLTDAVVSRLAQETDRSPDQVRQSTIAGEPAEIEQRLRPYIDAGITHFMVSAGAWSQIDNWQRVSDEVVPRFPTR